MKIRVGKCLFQSRTGLLILFLSAAKYIWGIPENKFELWGYIKRTKTTPASRTMSLELCKFPCVHLTRFRLVKKQAATVKAHTCALSLHGPFNGGFLRYEFGGAYIWRSLYTEGLIFGILRYLMSAHLRIIKITQNSKLWWQEKKKIVEIKGTPSGYKEILSRTTSLSLFSTFFRFVSSVSS